MPVARICVLVLMAALAAATAGPAAADPMGGRGMGGGGFSGGPAIGIGIGIGAALAAGAVAAAVEDARRRDEAAQAARPPRKEISEDEYYRRMNAGLDKLRKRPANRGIPDEQLQQAVMDAMNAKYQIAKPEAYDNDAAFERSRIQNREMNRINAGGAPGRPGPAADDPRRLKQSGMSQEEHDLLYKPGTRAKGTEW